MRSRKFLNTLVPILLFQLCLAQHITNGVLQGQKGWLYSSTELAHFNNLNIGYKSYTAKALYTLAQAAELFAANEISLIISIVPSKVNTYPEFLPTEYIPSLELHDRYETALQYLQNSSAIVPNIHGDFLLAKDEHEGFPLFQRLDHHWSSLGASTAAHSVVKELSQLNLDLGPSSSLTLNDTKIISISGDSTSLFPRLSNEEKLLFEQNAWAFEQALQFVFRENATEAIGLFDDIDPAITLVGDSFSDGDGKEGRWPFYSFLKLYSKQDILNVATSGSGPWLPMTNYLESETFVSNKPKVVIWEIWENFLEGFGQGEVPIDFIARLDRALNPSSLEAPNCEIYTKNERDMSWLNCFILSSIAREYYEHSIDYSEAALGKIEIPKSLWLSDFGIIGESGLRWAYGPSSSISFWSDSLQLANIHLTFRTPITTQMLVISSNDVPIVSINDIPVSKDVETFFDFQINRGWNTLNIDYKNWNHKNGVKSFETKEQLAIYIRHLDIVPK